MGAVPTEPPSLWSRVVGVAQLANCATRFRAVSDTPHAPFSFFFRSRNCSGVPPASSFVGVGHEV